MPTPIERILKPQLRDIGGFQVKRLLPGFPNKMVGPFIFLDHMGPVSFGVGQGIDVRPHPHIGLATVTYLFDGAILHRDSLGSVQPIQPGDVNWMTAGRGVVHSERTPPEDRVSRSSLHGIQTWVALPKAFEEIEPSFSHHPSATLPMITQPGVSMRLIAGSAFGARSPVPTFSETCYLAVHVGRESRFVLPPEHEERAIYVVEGAVSSDGQAIPLHHLAVLAAGESVEVRGVSESKLLVLGGARMDGDRHAWWNFVSSSKQRIERAKQDWRDGRFAMVPGESDWIPLPER